MEDQTDQIEALRESVAVLTDRVADLECAIRPVPFLIPLKTRTRVAVVTSSVLACLAIVFAFSPQDIRFKGWAYNSPGISAETIANIGAALGIWIAYTNHKQEKDDYRRSERNHDDHS
ncbi:MAG: hypothetical protein DCF32_22870 [Leptolyngbya sp.]|nr:MAG: hypothetical protein DCF32_22870 [Leptolyngbya sp.]